MTLKITSKKTQEAMYDYLKESNESAEGWKSKHSAKIRRKNEKKMNNINGRNWQLTTN